MDLKIKETTSQTEQRKIIGVQVPISMYEALLKRSQEEWVSISDIIRKVIKKYLSEEVRKDG